MKPIDKDLKTIIRKTLSLGLGIAALTKERAEAFAKELQKKGYLSPQEGKKLARDLLQQSEKQRKKIQDLAKKQIKTVFDLAGLALKVEIKKPKKAKKKKK